LRRENPDTIYSERPNIARGAALALALGEEEESGNRRILAPSAKRPLRHVFHFHVWENTKYMAGKYKIQAF
jgi:hypothetical protein